jgi:peptidoglycan/xylan/chitin deacetylase (PgdA/CDA1 family)
MNRTILNNKAKLWFKTILTSLRGYYIFRPFYSGVGTILLFHRVIPQEKQSVFNKYLEVSPDYLDSCINYFKENEYDIISLDDLYLRLTENRFDKRFVCFTFDDGYIDNYIYAYPLFKKYNIPFAIYITTNMVNRKLRAHSYILEDIILQNDDIELTLNKIDYYFPCKSKGEKMEAYLHIGSLGKSNYSIFTELSERYEYNWHHKNDTMFMTWDHLLAMGENPLVTLGAHTVNHFELSKLSFTDALNEILLSKAEIEQKCGSDVYHFAYPYGSFDSYGEREIDILKKASFKTATTTNIGNLSPQHRDSLFELPRNNVDGNLNKIEYLNLITSGASYSLKKLLGNFGF